LTLREACTDAADKVDGIIRKILKTPEDEKLDDRSVHDIRTSVRRFQSAYRVLPKKAKQKKSFQRYMDACTDLFKLLSEARDYDVILSRLSKYSESKALIDAKSSITKKRENLLKRVHKKALAIKRSSKKLNFQGVSESQLEKRFKTRLEKQARKTRDDLLVVWTGKAKKAQIHGLRKDCKKLRYTLELDEKKYEKQMELMKEWQGYLGTVHDVEMTQNLLRKKNKRGEIDSIIRSEEEKSKESYETFMTKSRTEETRAMIEAVFLRQKKPQAIG